MRSGARSYVVRTVKLAEHLQAMQVREWLECKGVELAINKLRQSDIDSLRKQIVALKDTNHQEPIHWQVDDALHMLCPRASGNIVLTRLITQARVSNRLFELTDLDGRVDDDRMEHLAIIDALEAKDLKAAKKALVTHFINMKNYVITKIGV